MAVVGGYEGTVTWASGGYITNVFSWAFSQDFDLWEYLTFASHDAYGSIAGAYKTKGTLSCYLDDTTAPAAIASGTAAASLVLTAFTARTFTFTAHLTQLAPAVSVQAGPNTITVGFAADGALAYG